jgi:hypothetical protein
MGYEVFVFNKYGREIDFLAQKDGKEYLIQTAYSIAEEKKLSKRICLVQYAGSVAQKDHYHNRWI